MDDATTGVELNTRYTPVAIYYEDADTVEYIREDVPSVHRRVDGFLTLTLGLGTRKPIGFRLKGFKNFYIRHLKTQQSSGDRDHFFALVKVIEKATELLGTQVFEDERRAAYDQAHRIAEEDNAALHELPDAA
jgi:hypothetical protein